MWGFSGLPMQRSVVSRLFDELNSQFKFNSRGAPGLMKWEGGTNFPRIYPPASREKFKVQFKVPQLLKVSLMKIAKRRALAQTTSKSETDVQQDFFWGYTAICNAICHDHNKGNPPRLDNGMLFSVFIRVGWFFFYFGKCIFWPRIYRILYDILYS